MLDALFSARGRMRRRDWWLWFIALSIAFILAGVFVHTWFGTSTVTYDMAQLGKGPMTLYGAWLIFTNTIGTWPYVCVTAKRWHDRNRSGWLAALLPGIGIPEFAIQHFSGWLNGLVSRFVVGAIDGTLTVVGVLALIWIVIDCGILDGTQGQNRYGPSPKGVGAQPEDIF